MGLKLGLTVRLEHKLWLFNSKVLRKVSDFKREDITGDRRKLHNDVPGTSYSGDQIMRAM
jgi:hypothetical protein